MSCFASVGPAIGGALTGRLTAPGSVGPLKSRGITRAQPFDDTASVSQPLARRARASLFRRGSARSSAPCGTAIPRTGLRSGSGRSLMGSGKREEQCRQSGRSTRILARRGLLDCASDGQAPIRAPDDQTVPWDESRERRQHRGWLEHCSGDEGNCLTRLGPRPGVAWSRGLEGAVRRRVQSPHIVHNRGRETSVRLRPCTSEKLSGLQRRPEHSSQSDVGDGFPF